MIHSATNAYEVTRNNATKRLLLRNPWYRFYERFGRQKATNAPPSLSLQQSNDWVDDFVGSFQKDKESIVIGTSMGKSTAKKDTKKKEEDKR